MVELVSKTTVFQHLDTYPIGGSSLYLFGRELKGESVAIKVNNIRPHFCVKLPDGIGHYEWMQQLRKNVHSYSTFKICHFNTNIIYLYCLRLSIALQHNSTIYHYNAIPY